MSGVGCESYRLYGNKEKVGYIDTLASLIDNKEEDTDNLKLFVPREEARLADEDQRRRQRLQEEERRAAQEQLELEERRRQLQQELEQQRQLEEERRRLEEVHNFFQIFQR